jgi:uncharacterized membrane protein YeaQ/YmgE (transglycosylase-associated protein family)
LTVVLAARAVMEERMLADELPATSGLVGIAGSFVGYHLALLIGIVGYSALLVAVIGALAVLWGWRTVR